MKPTRREGKGKGGEGKGLERGKDHLSPPKLKTQASLMDGIESLE